jgi:hypothetical protein
MLRKPAIVAASAVRPQSRDGEPATRRASACILELTRQGSCRKEVPRLMTFPVVPPKIVN